MEKTSIKNKTPDRLLHAGLEELNLTPCNEYAASFNIYLTELNKWNRVHNLTGLKKKDDIIIKHFLDSLLYLKVMPEGTLRIADIGSGAGFPGIPIKIVRPEIQMYLIESSVKKSLFLRHITSLLHLQKVVVIEERVEDIKGLSPVDICVTRALFTIEDFIKRASHIIKKGGIMIHSKGPKVEKELKKLRDVAYEVIPCTLPFTKIKRYIVAVKI